MHAEDRALSGAVRRSPRLRQWPGVELAAAGRSRGAHACALRAVEAAGDGGSLRLRAMALGLLATTLAEPAAGTVRQRAIAIAERLDDEVLRVRLELTPGTWPRAFLVRASPVALEPVRRSRARN